MVMIGGIFALYVLLLYRDPFSERTLIPNFEPFPDAFHYVVPARTFLAGKGLYLLRAEGAPVAPNVPPLYSLSFLPTYLLISDPRAYYVTNAVLAVASFWIFFALTAKLVINRVIRGLLLLSFAVAFPVTWVPSLAMAENLLLPLFLLCCYWLTLPLSHKKVMLAGLLTVSLYATKYAALPLTCLFGVLYLLKIWRETQANAKVGNIIRFGLTGCITLGLFFWGEFLQKGRNPFLSLLRLITPLIESVDSSTVANSKFTVFFSLTYLTNHWPQYWAGLFGNTQAFLWQHIALLPMWIALLGGFGLLLAMYRGAKQRRWLAAAFFLFILGQLSFISTFYVVDLRFIYVLFPLLLIGFGWWLEMAWSHLPQKFSVMMLGIAFLGLAIFLPPIRQIKQQIGLNLKYAETPWYYLSIKNMNQYFDSHAGSRPVVISALDPYLIDFYAEDRYHVLPLSEEQNHSRELWPKIWGADDYSDLVALYTGYLEAGREVFVMKYGLGNEAALHADYARLEQNFTLTQVQDGCYGLCGVYRVEKK